MQANETHSGLKLSAGRLLSAVAIVFCVPLGALFVSIATGAVGVFLGITGYVLGAKRIGALAVVLCTAAMFVGLLVGQGVLLCQHVYPVEDGIPNMVVDTNGEVER